MMTIKWGWTLGRVGTAAVPWLQEGHLPCSFSPHQSLDKLGTKKIDEQFLLALPTCVSLTHPYGQSQSKAG